jgi:hypothetical protein
MMRNSLLVLAGLALASVGSAQTIINANNPSGDAITNAGPSVLTQNITATGAFGEQFVYRNVRNGGMVGIDSTFARSGTGSLHFVGPGGNAQSELAFGGGFDANGNITGPSLGLLDNLSAFKADFYTASSNVANAMAILRLEVFSSNDSGNSYGQLVFDNIWGTGPESMAWTFGQWGTVDLFANANSIYLRGTSGLASRYGTAQRTLADWLTTLNGKGYDIFSVNAGWGTSVNQFEGAVDNITFGVGANIRTYNFEPVPEPATMAALGLGAVALIRRRKKA